MTFNEQKRLAFLKHWGNFLPSLLSRYWLSSLLRGLTRFCVLRLLRPSERDEEDTKDNHPPITLKERRLCDLGRRTTLPFDVIVRLGRRDKRRRRELARRRRTK
eukprot:GHVT01020885.1.p6 GENE.GHVT01020885.1~~GHVT01020885.1.p6  ORF type:complete len:104 (+),score=17.11 GHVT01020885.1:147-458(+)